MTEHNPALHEIIGAVLEGLDANDCEVQALAYEVLTDLQNHMIATALIDLELLLPKPRERIRQLLARTAGL